ncbi:MAG: response regulator transcription factor [Elusimicrobia bacterium]|nr:response regulator transcription factor [Elusimicrobiota bacterium]
MPSPRPDRLLVVSSDRGTRESLTELAALDGFEAAAAESAPAALELAARGPVDAALVQAGSPSFWGYGLVEALRRGRPGAALVLMTGAVLKKYELIRGLASGADGYVEFPCDSARLMKELRERRARWKAKSETQRAVSEIERGFKSALSFDELAKKAGEFRELAWSGGESYYVGYHVTGRTETGAEVDIQDPASADVLHANGIEIPSIEQARLDWGFDVALYIPPEHPPDATAAFLSFIQGTLLPALKKG